MPVRKLRWRHLVAVSVALLAASCSGGSEEGSASGGGGGAGADAGAVAIVEPADGAEVQVPFTLKVSSEFELGPTDKGVHHVHLFFDGDDSKYEVVESDSFEVTSLPEGKHTINVSLRNADHSPAGAEAKIEVNVTGGGGGGGGTDTTSRYDY